MPSAADNLALIKRKAMAYALAQGGNEYDGAAFGDVLGGISWVESRLGQQMDGDGGESYGLFHTNVGGRNLSGIGRSADLRTMKAILSDPNVDIDNSLPELWDHFQRHGGVAKFAKDPAFFTAQVALTGQRPDRGAWEKVTNSGGYRDGVQIAQGQKAATAGGSPLQAAAGLASAPTTPAVKVNRTPVQGGITSRFGSAVALDSGATYQGKAYPNFNKGVDFGAAGGSPVTAVVGGQVMFVGDDGAGWGPRVIIRDSEGFDHSYGHLDAGSLAALRGVREVQTGQQIGTVATGKVGTSTGPHLSYDISKNGEPVDPTPWLGEGVREQGIPAGQVAPTYLGVAGGAMTTAPSGFYGEQVAAAQADYQTYLTEAAQLRTKANRTAEENARLEELEGDGITSAGLVGAALERIQAFQKLATDAAKTTPGADPTAIAAGIQNVRDARNEHNRWIFEQMVDLLDKNFDNQLGVAGMIRDIFNLNESNAQAAAASAIAKGQLDQSGAEAIVQAHAMKQTAEAARAMNVLAWTKAINENDWRIAERRLPPGTDYVPFLEPDSDLMTVARSLGLSGKGLGVVPTDFNRLDIRNTVPDAEQNVPEVGDFAIPQLTGTVQRNQGIQPYRAGTLTNEAARVPTAPNMAGLNPNAIGMATPGDLSDEDIIDILLQRGKYAPPAQSASVATTTNTAPATTTNAAPPTENDVMGPPVPPGYYESRRINPAPVQPGTPEHAAMQGAPSRTDPPPIEPGTPAYAAMHGGADAATAAERRKAELEDLLATFGLGRARDAASGATAAASGVISRGRRWLK